MNMIDLKAGKIYACKTRFCIYNHPKFLSSASLDPSLMRREIPEDELFVLLKYTTFKTTDTKYISATLLTANGEIGYVTLSAKYLYLCQP